MALLPSNKHFSLSLRWSYPVPIIFAEIQQLHHIPTTGHNIIADDVSDFRCSGVNQLVRVSDLLEHHLIPHKFQWWNH